LKLVPYLLARAVQSVLAGSQEGGHHPRFDEDALMVLPVPESLLAKRAEASASLVKSAAPYRESERTMLGLIGEAETVMTEKGPSRPKRSTSRKVR